MALPSVWDNTVRGDGKKCGVPTQVHRGDQGSARYVTPQTAARVLDGEFSDAYERIFIVDCRFPYEYQGGHIKVSKDRN